MDLFLLILTLMACFLVGFFGGVYKVLCVCVLFFSSIICALAFTIICKDYVRPRMKVSSPEGSTCLWVVAM